MSKKNPKDRNIYLSMKHRLGYILIAIMGAGSCYLIPSFIQEQIFHNLSYPDIVSVDPIKFLIIAGSPLYLVLALGSPYIILTGVIPYKPAKLIIAPSGYLTLAGMFLAVIYPIGFTSALEQKGYGHCWKETMKGPTLYVKDANECVKRNLPIMIRPRDQPKEDTPATIYEDPFHKWKKKS